MKRIMVRAGTARKAFFGLLIASILLLYCSSLYAQELTASYYDVASLKRDGQWSITKGRCADGSIFRDDKLTGAYNGYPLGIWVRVVSCENGRSVIVKITDRTAKRFTGKRIDLSLAAMYRLDGIRKGVIPVVVELIKDGR